ncbi:MAG: HdeD family acid-resistance protein [Lachnospiraceae bacterium]
MKFIKYMKKSTIISSVIYIIVGLLLAIFPGSTARTIGYAFATVVLIVGLGFLYRYFSKDVRVLFVGNELVTGIVLVALSLFVFLRVDSVVSVIPFFLGIIITISGVTKLQDAISFQRVRYGGSIYVYVLAVLNIIFGILLMLNPFKAVETLIMLIGFGLVYSGVTDLITLILVTKNIMRMQDRDGIIEVEAREVDSEI